MSSYYDDASLMLLASGGAQKDGKVYSVKPTDGSGDFTFTRGSNLSATRVDASQLIEKGRENLVKQSNSFSTAPWTITSNATLTSGQSGYDGSNDAWKLEANTTAQTYANQVLLSSISAFTPTTFSVYAKSGNVDFLKLLIVCAGDNSIITFDLTDGSNSSNLRNISVNAENVGNGWYKLSVIAAPDAQINAVRAEVRSTASDAIAAAGSFVYIQDSQVELGLAASPYIETGASTAQAGILENTPRFDYSGGATCPSLLLEPSRTNTLPQSEYIYAGGGYNFTGSSVVTYNAATSPEGVQNAALFNFPVNNAGFYNFATGSDKSVGDKITMSLFAKLKLGSSTNIIKIGYGGYSVGGDKLSEFNLSTGIVTYTHPSVDSAIIEDYGNGWYRLIQTQTCIAAGNAGVVAYGAGNIDVYIWGVQSEDASYSTSYIPTYGVSQTRAVDDCRKTGVSSLIGQTEGTFFWEGQNIGDENSPYIALYTNTTNRVLLYYTSGGVSTQVRVGGVVEFQGDAQAVSGITKMAVAYKNGDYAFYVDGVQAKISTGSFSGFISPQLDNIDLGYNNQDGSKNNQLLVFKTRLSNLDLAILTGATTYNTFAEMALALNYTVYE